MLWWCKSCIIYSGKKLYTEYTPLHHGGCDCRLQVTLARICWVEFDCTLWRFRGLITYPLQVANAGKLAMHMFGLYDFSLCMTFHIMDQLFFDFQGFSVIKDAVVIVHSRFWMDFLTHQLMGYKFHQTLGSICSTNSEDVTQHKSWIQAGQGQYNPAAIFEYTVAGNVCLIPCMD